MEGCEDPGGTVKFASICAVLDEVCSSNSRDEKLRALDRLFSATNIPNETRASGQNVPPGSLFNAELGYAIMRLVLPDLDKERAAYGMREKSLGDMYSQLLQLPKGSALTERLKKWKDPTVQARTGGRVTAAGNFCAVLETVLKGRCSTTSQLSVADVNHLLDELNQSEIVFSAGGFVNNHGSAGAERRNIIQQFITHGTDKENLWITKIILKDNKLGVGFEAILRWYHPAALAHYKGTQNLALVCKECQDPRFEVTSQDAVTLGAPAQPMLCHRLRDASQLREVVKVMSDGMQLEPKFDGERLQLHKMAVARSIRAVDCILDGEVLLWNDAVNAFENFERIRSYIRSEHRAPNPDASTWVKYVVFDVLYLDQKKGGEPSRILNLPLKYRREILQKVVAGDCGVISLAPALQGSTVADIFAAVEKYVANKHEGVVVKSVSSKYVLGGRDVATAVKVKPDYLEGVLDDLDLLIIGGNYGTGHSRLRSGKVSHFFVGVRNDSGDGRHSSEEQPVFGTVGRVGSGYSEEQLRSLEERLGSHWIPFNPLAPPPFMDQDYKYVGKRVPDVVIDPRFSEVLQIRVYELNNSPESSSGIQMRFPRVQRLRPDRGWKDCMTLSELRKCVTEQGARTSESIALLSHAHKSKKRRRVVPSTSRDVSVVPHFRAANLSSAKKENDVLQGRTYHVVGDSATVAKKFAVERLLHRLGGSAAQNMTPECEAMITVSRDSVTVRNWIQACSGARGRSAEDALRKLGGPRDVLDVSWLEECEARGALVLPRTQQVLFATPSLTERMTQEMDEFGDSWVEATDPETLKATLGVVRQKFSEKGSAGAPQADPEQEEIAGLWTLSSPFRGWTVRVEEDTGAVAQLLRFFGAICVSSANPEVLVTHELRKDGGARDSGAELLEEQEVWAKCEAVVTTLPRSSARLDRLSDHG